jgi:hypothetical protein
MTRRYGTSCQDARATCHQRAKQQKMKGKLMKKSSKLVSLFGFALAIAVTTARGQPNTITVDEFGIGSYNGVPLLSGSQPDPINGGIPGLAYTLPFIYNWSVPAADIQLFEPGTTQPSDLLRFTRDPSGPNTLLFFYSDAAVPGDSPDAPADVLVMPPLVFPFTSGPEIGLFGNTYSETGPNGFLYTALPGMPGEDGTGVALNYTFISDNVTIAPEPSSLALLAGGFGILCSFNLFRRKVLS